jgi:hypothetical protein
MRTYLERIDPARRMARFYAVMVQPTLLGEWALVASGAALGRAARCARRSTLARPLRTPRLTTSSRASDAGAIR